MTIDLDKKAKQSLKKITKYQLMELDTCSHCALCTQTCPAYIESRDVNHAPGSRSTLAVKLYDKKFSILSQIIGEKKVTNDDIKNLSESVYNCTLCGRCMEVCPFGIQTHELWNKIREIINDLDGTPSNILRLGKMLEENMNPYGLEPDTRLDWTDYTDLEDIPEKEKAEIAYFVGCTTAYKGANHEIAFSVASILNLLDEDWTLLGENEWCCGNPNLLSGDEHSAKIYAKHNVETLESKEVKKVLFGCAGCYKIFKWEYPKLLEREPRFEIVHAVEYLEEVLKSGRLKVTPTDKKVIYHDPCDLARLGGITKAPREALQYLTKNLIEFDENRQDVVCCGGGGLLQAVNPDMRLGIIQKRLEQAVEKGAQMIVSACPSCKLAFVDGVRELGFNLEVYDIIELAAILLDLL